MMLRRITPLTLYLFADQLARWRQRPSSLLARFVTVAVMASTATAILLLFHLGRREVENRIDAIGLNRIMVSQTLSTGRSDVQSIRVSEYVQPLASTGNLFTLKRAFEQADTELNVKADIYTVHPAAWVADLAHGYHNILITDSIPPGKHIACWVAGYQLDAVSAKPLDWMNLLSNHSDMLLLGDQNLLSESHLESWITLYEHTSQTPTLQEIYSGLMQWSRDLNLKNIKVDHALKAIDQLGNLQSQLAGWRFVLIILFGAGISIIFSLLVILEIHENRQVNLVLRSMGAPGGILVVRQFLEGLIVSNLAVALTWFGMVYGMPLAFESFGYSAGVVTQNVVADVLWQELPVIGGFVNFGLLISLIPVMKSVGGEIGRDLG